MKVLAKVAALGAAFVLAACSMTLPVRGQNEAGTTTFTGSATGYMDGSGTLSLVRSDGVSCQGDFVYVTRRNGEGTFRCADGRSGPFSFVSTGSRGTGTGRLGGENFTFTFGG